MEEGRFEDEMLRNIGVDIDEDATNIFQDLLNETQLLRAAFPVCSSIIPNSFYEAKQKLCDLGLRYETIHPCKYDCVSYWKELADLQHCPTCGSANRRWHRDKRVETDDVLRHPADPEGWKHFDGFNPFGQMSTSYSM
ncbi:hypothetical protein E6C27_scaffold75G00710 [Cucumis melo var. makuwa]|uniref:Transposase n=1 Tax=Cucumis melo var. makuwa TaxID=1194695 RepID=A0A5A7TMH9_CUCMM|nr:hypothetical protein E6C27_scaffold75G00710 [Cucumis melo var. makuwa]